MEALIFIVMVIVGVGLPIASISIQYTGWWHKLRKRNYRIVQATVVAYYSDEPITKYIIQRERVFGLGWKDNPDVPGYDSDGEVALYGTEPYDTLSECQRWMDRIVAVTGENSARRDNVVG